MRAGNNLLIIVITVMTAALAFYQAGAYAGDLPGEDNEDKMPESVGSGLSQYIIDQKNDIADDVGADPKSEFSPSSVTYNSDGTIATADFASDGVMATYGYTMNQQGDIDKVVIELAGAIKTVISVKRTAEGKYSVSIDNKKDMAMNMEIPLEGVPGKDTVYIEGIDASGGKDGPTIEDIATDPTIIGRLIKSLKDMDDTQEEVARNIAKINRNYSEIKDVILKEEGILILKEEGVLEHGTQAPKNKKEEKEIIVKLALSILDENKDALGIAAGPVLSDEEIDNITKMIIDEIINDQNMKRLRAMFKENELQIREATVSLAKRIEELFNGLNFTLDKIKALVKKGKVIIEKGSNGELIVILGLPQKEQ